jgi:uncharacterized protein
MGPLEETEKEIMVASEHPPVSSLPYAYIDDIAAKTLKSYVYLYIDPRDGRPFYIGKGAGNRLFAHLNDRSESEKTARIAEIRDAGLEPQIDILRYGLSDSEARLVEAAAIDLYGKGNLTNRVAGYHQGSFGHITSQELILMFTARPVEVRHRVMLITINRLYRSGMTELELYEATRGTWVVGEHRNRVEYAFAVYQGIVREVYRIEKWHPAGTLSYETRELKVPSKQRRWEFSGHVADDIRGKYVGFSVGKGGQNPIRYVNV